MSWSTGMAIALVVLVAVMWVIVLAQAFNKPRNRFLPDGLAERKRNIAARGYRNSYNREWI